MDQLQHHSSKHFSQGRVVEEALRGCAVPSLYPLFQPVTSGPSVKDHHPPPNSNFGTKSTVGPKAHYKTTNLLVKKRCFVGGRGPTVFCWGPSSLPWSSPGSLNFLWYNMNLPRHPHDVGRIALARSTEDIVMPETVANIANTDCL